MDELSAELYLNAKITIEDFEDNDRVQAACLAIFGRKFTDDDFAEFIGAPDGSELVVDSRPRDSGELELHLGYKWFQGTHDYKVYVDNGRRVVNIENARSHSEAPRGLETRIFAKQVNSFRKYGIHEIRLYAEGYPNHPNGVIGYYVWAVFGFSMDIGGLTGKLIQDGFPAAETTLELMLEPGGAHWWYINGGEREAVFYLDDNSLSLAVLNAYLANEKVDLNAD